MIRFHRFSSNIVFVLTVFSLSVSTFAYYISYEKPHDYVEGESVSLKPNKLMSPQSLVSYDYSHLPPCGGGGGDVVAPPERMWQRAVSALHGDAYRSANNVYQLNMKRDVSCRQLCLLDLSDPSELSKWQNAITNGLQYHWLVDDLPVAYHHEDQSYVAIKYWGGVPVGQTGLSDTEKASSDGDQRYFNYTASDLFLYNHMNFEIQYSLTAEQTYRIVRATVQPFSIQHNFAQNSSATILPVYLNNPTASCVSTNLHTTYDELTYIPPQRLTGQKILITYDVIWSEYLSNKDPYDSRWNVYLTMDNAIPTVVHVFGLVVALLINCFLFGSLITWLLRDLSYKPLIQEADFTDEQAIEIKLWPLSAPVFWAPTTAPNLFCVLCGVGAQLWLSTLLFVFFFSVGVINQSLQADILTPAILIYVFSSPFGGYVTARLALLFDFSHLMAMVLSLALSFFFPIISLIVCHLVYDVFPIDSLAPHYRVLANAVPVILLFIFLIIPLTIVGGVLGYWHGPVQQFRVVKKPQKAPIVATRLQDLSALDIDVSIDDKEQNCAIHYFVDFCRNSAWWILSGLLPVLGSFVEYGYNVAAPIYLGFFSSSTCYPILALCFFISSVCGVSLLFYYKRLRSHQYSWWWISFWTGSLSGLFVFILSLTWLTVGKLEVAGRTKTLFVFWFAYISWGVSLMAGFIAVLSCVIFNRVLYCNLMKRFDDNDNDNNDDDNDNIQHETASNNLSSTTIIASQLERRVSRLRNWRHTDQTLGSDDATIPR